MALSPTYKYKKHILPLMGIGGPPSTENSWHGNFHSLVDILDGFRLLFGQVSSQGFSRLFGDQKELGSSGVGQLEGCPVPFRINPDWNFP